MATIRVQDKSLRFSGDNAKFYLGTQQLPIVTRTRPMQVLVLGMNRTGTSSLACALTQLGYKPYSYVQSLILGHIPLWNQAMRNQSTGGEAWSKKDFDKLLGEFDSILDTPAIMLRDDLLAAYPHAKVILNVRPASAWLDSMHRSLIPIFTWPSWSFLQYIDPTVARPFYTHTRLIWGIFCDNNFSDESLVRRYERWNEHIRQTVPKDRLLELNIGDGWKPLCDFLGVEVPHETEYPHAMDAEMIMEAHTSIWWAAVQNGARNVMLLGCVIGGCVWLARRSR